MGRKRSFEENDVIEKAVAQFWRYGYSGTSIRDLERATGINSASLYNTFGDKKQIYGRVLSYYIDTFLNARCAHIVRETSPRSALEDLLWDAFEWNSDTRMGCLLIVSGSEIGPHDADVKKLCVDAWMRLEATVYEAVGRAQAMEQIAPSIDGSRLSKSVIATLVSVCTLSRAGFDPEFLRSLVETQIEAFDVRPAGKLTVPA